MLDSVDRLADEGLNQQASASFAGRPRALR